MATATTSSYGSLLREVADSAKDLVHSEVGLIKAELKESIRRAAAHSAQATIFGALLALSLIPFMAFLVIGLGDLLDGRYWLSSLIVAAIFALGGGYMTYVSYDNLKNEDFTLPHARRGLDRQKNS